MLDMRIEARTFGSQPRLPDINVISIICYHSFVAFIVMALELVRLGSFGGFWPWLRGVWKSDACWCGEMQGRPSTPLIHPA